MADGSDEATSKVKSESTASVRAGRVIVLGVVLIGFMLAMALGRLVSSRREYVVERGYRLLGLGTSRIADAVDGAYAKLSLLPPDKSSNANTSKVRFHYDRDVESFDPDVEAFGARMNGIDPNEEWRYHAWTRQILDSIAYDQRQFDDVCLVDETGRVLTQRFNRASSDPLTSLADRAAARAAIMGKEDPSQPSLQRVLDEFLLGGRASYATYGPELDWTSTDLPIRLLYRRQEQVAFCRKIEWKRPASVRAPRLALCGIRLERSINAEVWTLSPTLAGAAALVLALAGLGWPILKLRYLGRQERLRARDARVLVLTCIAGVGILTAVIAMIYAQQRATAYFDRDAEEFAREFEKRLSAQLAQAATQLDRFREVVAGIPGEPDDRVCAQLETLEYADFTNLGWIGADGSSKLLCRRTGTRLEATGKVPDKLDNRQYFKDVRAGHLWPWEKGAGNGSPPPVALDSLVTKSTGEVALALAVSVEPNVPKSAKGLVVMTATPRAAFKLMLPDGFKFALVQDDGKVRVHSEAGRAFNEDIFEETGAPPSLVAMITGRSAAALGVDYYGSTPHRIYVHPLANTPWTLVVLRDRTIEHTALAATAVAWLAAFATYLAIIVAVLIVVVASRGRVRLQWFWPASNRADSYRWMVMALVLLGMLALTAGRWGDAPVIVPAVFLPVAAMSALHLAFQQPGRRARYLAPIVLLGASLAVMALTLVHSGWIAAAAVVVVAGGVAFMTRRAHEAMGVEDEPATFRLSYVALMTLVLLELSAWPSLALFVDAWDGVMTAVVRRSEMQYARMLDQRGARYPDERPSQREEYYVPTLSGTPPTEVAAARSSSVVLDAVTRALCGSPTGTAPEPSAQCHELVGLASRSLSSLAFLAVKPYTTTAAELQQLVHEHSGDGRWTSQRTDSKVHYTMRRTAYAPEISLEATLPRLAIPRGLVGYAAVLALALMIFWTTALALRFIVLRLFAIGPRMPDRTLRASDRAAPAIWLFARLRDRAIADLWSLEPAMMRVVDPTLASDPKTFSLSPPAAPEVLVIDRLEARLGVDVWDDRLLTELERLEANVEFVLVSATDPIFFLNARRGEAEAAGTLTPEAFDRFSRWMRLLASCASERRTLQECEPAGAFGGLLAAHLPPFEQWSHDAWYWHLWATSTQGEKLAMAQLADEGFLNPNGVDVARQLFDRGLVFRGPELTFFSPSFHEFVLRVRTPNEVEALETELADAGWARIQRPLTIVIGLLVVFFVLTQPALYSVVIGVLTAFTTLVPKVLDLLGRFLPTKKPAE